MKVGFLEDNGLKVTSMYWQAGRQFKRVRGSKHIYNTRSLPPRVIAYKGLLADIETNSLACHACVIS